MAQNQVKDIESAAFRLSNAALTDPGRVRDMNQDTFATKPEIGLYLVADGMGGKAGGELASRLAMETLVEELSKQIRKLKHLDSPGRRSFFSACVNKASLKIYERSLELPQYRGMGTTTTLLWAPPFEESSSVDPSERYAIIAHVGDSRLYLVRAGMLFQLTSDHSLVSEQIKAGILSPKDPMLSHIRNVITRCVGYQEEEEVDTLSLRLESGDRFLLCSDGLTNKVEDEELREALVDLPLESIPPQLVALANERGGEDNITAVVIHVT